MALSFIKLFQPSQLAAADALIYAVPLAPTSTLLRNARVRLTNTTGGAVAATLYAVPAGGAAAVANEFFPAVSIGAGAFVDVDVPQMAAGDALYGFAGSAGSISIAAMDGVLQS
jgi:hypothetical protein